MNYNVDDIKIGDQVIFHVTEHNATDDQYWTVIAINGEMLKVELKSDAADKMSTIHVKEVVGLIPRFFT